MNREHFLPIVTYLLPVGRGYLDMEREFRQNRSLLFMYGRLSPSLMIFTQRPAPYQRRIE